MPVMTAPAPRHGPVKSIVKLKCGFVVNSVTEQNQNVGLQSIESSLLFTTAFGRKWDSFSPEIVTNLV